MSSATIDGIATRYEVIGSGPLILMYAPRGFNPTACNRICEGMCRSLFDRDTAPVDAPEDLMRLDIRAFVVPGYDAAHATSAARYLEECLPRAEYWDLRVELQTEDATNARVLRFFGEAK
jgi:hypothetical protein